MNTERLERLAEDLLEIPEKIRSRQTEMLDMNEDMASLQKEILKKISNIKNEIATATDAAGKKLYSNQDARDNAFLEREESDTFLYEDREKMNYLSRESSIIKNDIESLQNQMGAIKSILNFFSNKN
jgi:peptidoglycan hydrolase CwlO-like protein